jgi:hypothetical protein
MKSLAPWTNWTNSAGAAPSAGTLLASIKPDTKDGEGSDWVLSQANPTGDFYLKVEVKRRGGPSSASAGLVFGRSKSEYYLFEMSDQSYRLLTWTGMTYEFTRAWTKSFATRPGQINSISVLSTGSKRILFINDQKVDQITEAPSSSSYFGLRIDAETAELVTFAFDNFELRGRPEITAAPGK